MSNISRNPSIAEFDAQRQTRQQHAESAKKVAKVAGWGSLALAATLGASKLGLGSGISDGDHIRPTADQRAAVARGLANSMPTTLAHPNLKLEVTFGDEPENNTIWAEVNRLQREGYIDAAHVVQYEQDAVIENHDSSMVQPGQSLEIEIDHQTPSGQ